MHDILISVWLGIVEGVTEFLPVSSTGHLLVAERLLGISDSLGSFHRGDPAWRDPGGGGDLFSDLLAGAHPFAVLGRSAALALGIILAFLPAALVGVLVSKWINSTFLNPGIAMPVIAASWIIGGIVILVLERRAPKARWLDGERLPLSKAFQIGLCQVLALIPGTSRSGATSLGGELLGVDRIGGDQIHLLSCCADDAGRDRVRALQEGREPRSRPERRHRRGLCRLFPRCLLVIRRFLVIVGRHGLAPFGWYRLAAGLALAAYIWV